MIDGNIYHYCDYNKKGALVQAYERSGERGLKVEFKLMIPFMYCSGKGVTLKESLLFNQPQAGSVEEEEEFSSKPRGTKSRLQTDVSNGLTNSNSVETAGDHRINLPTCEREDEEKVTFKNTATSSELTRKVCWKLGFRGLYGEVSFKKLFTFYVSLYTVGSLCYMYWLFATPKFTLRLQKVLLLNFLHWFMMFLNQMNISVRNIFIISTITTTTTTNLLTL